MKLTRTTKNILKSPRRRFATKGTLKALEDWGKRNYLDRNSIKEYKREWLRRYSCQPYRLFMTTLDELMNINKSPDYISTSGRKIEYIIMKIWTEDIENSLLTSKCS